MGFNFLIEGKQGLHITQVSLLLVGWDSPLQTSAVLWPSAKTCSEASLKPAAIWGHPEKAETAQIPHGHSSPTPKTWLHGQGKRLQHSFIYW